MHDHKREKPWRPSDPERSPNWDFGYSLGYSLGYSQDRWILTSWEDEHPGGVMREEYGKQGTPSTVLRELTDPIWHDRLIRLGHARAVYPMPPLGEPGWRREEHPYHVDAIEPGWEHYRVFLRDGVDGEDGRELDLEATLAENGLGERRTWVRFEKGEG